MSSAGSERGSANSVKVTQLFARLIEQDDRDARDELVRMHLPLAHSLSHRYAGGGEPVEDLRQVASLALVKAVDRYDPDRGIPFSAYLVPSVLGEIKRYFRDFGWSVHLERRTQELVLAIRNARTQLEHTGQSATVSELANFLKVPAEQILDALNASASQYAISYDRTGDDDDDNAPTVLDRFAVTDQGFAQVEQRELLERASGNLDERDRRALDLYYRAELSQEQIAQRLGISQMQVSRILKRSLETLRAEVRSDDADPQA